MDRENVLYISNGLPGHYTKPSRSNRLVGGCEKQEVKGWAKYKQGIKRYKLPVTKSVSHGDVQLLRANLRSSYYKINFLITMYGDKFNQTYYDHF